MTGWRALVLGLMVAGLPTSPSFGGATEPHAGLSCTTFMATDGVRVLLGDSEDAGLDHPLAGDPTASYVFFRSATADEYGRMHTGWLWQGKHASVEAGMNDQGLAYALTAVPEEPMNAHPERPFTHGQDSFYDRILRKAATVAEAIEETLRFDFAACWFQIQYADASGDSAILSPGCDGEFAIARCDDGVGVFVASTFNLKEPSRFIGRDSFRRYDQAHEALRLAMAGSPLTVAGFTDALQAVDRHGAYAFSHSQTMYSTIYDLGNLEATIYVMCQYEDPVVFELREELAQGDHRIALRDAVPKARLERAERKYWVTQIGGFAGLALAGIALVGAVVFGLLV